MKTQGTSKLSCYCTAAITAKIESETCLEVTIHTTHYGHRMSLAHVHLSDSDKVAIAGKLSQGVDIQYILNDVRDNIGSKIKDSTYLQEKILKILKGPIVSLSTKDTKTMPPVFIFGWKR